jgi:hypothetical protein
LGRLKETEPVLPVICDSVTVPVGKYPLTVTLQVMIVDEPATADIGLQETVVLVAFVVTIKLYVPADWKLLASPP